MSSDLLILITAFAVCAVMGPFLIPFLHKLKYRGKKNEGYEKNYYRRAS